MHASTLETLKDNPRTDQRPAVIGVLGNKISDHITKNRFKTSPPNDQRNRDVLPESRALAGSEESAVYIEKYFSKRIYSADKCAACVLNEINSELSEDTIRRYMRRARTRLTEIFDQYVRLDADVATDEGATKILAGWCVHLNSISVLQGVPTEFSDEPSKDEAAAALKWLLTEVPNNLSRSLRNEAISWIDAWSR